jgi:hypothetical protein
MPIVIDLPTDLEADLRTRLGDLDATAKEAFAVEMYRQHKLTRAQLSKLLGVSRFGADDILKRHQAYDEITADDVSREAGELQRLRTNS